MFFKTAGSSILELKKKKSAQLDIPGMENFKE